MDKKNDSENSEGQINIFTGEIETFRKGKDEMNLAEFPISVVADSAPPGQLTLTFSDTIKDKSTGEFVDRSVTVHGTEEWGLPAAHDDDVMVGLLQLCYLMGWPKTIRFTRYQLCQMLRWSIGGANYQRIYKALHRLSTTNYNYRYAWRDRENQEWIPSQVFSYIQALKVHEADRPTDSGLCEVTWSDDFHHSLKAGNLKGIDFELFVKLKKSISKRLYRFLDKRFGGGWSKVTYPLNTLAFEKIGISRNYSDAGQVKRLLKSAIKELEAHKYLQPMPSKERFRRMSRGVWEVSFERYKPTALQSIPEAQGDTQSDSPIEERLVKLGIFPNEARKFVSDFPEKYLREKIDQFQFRSPTSNPAGLLADSIRRDLPPPPGYQTPEQREQQKATNARRQHEEQKQQAEKQRAISEQDARDEKLRQLAEAKLNNLPESDRVELEKDARRLFPKAGDEVIRQLMISKLLEQTDQI